MRIIGINTTLLSLVVFIGCATGSVIVTGKASPAISSAEVKIYLDPPSQYETIGIVEASSNVEFSTQAAQDRVINKLKSKAAKIGATGVLLLDIGERSGDMVGFYSDSVFYASTSETKTAKGEAIFIIQE